MKHVVLVAFIAAISALAAPAASAQKKDAPQGTVCEAIAPPRAELAKVLGPEIDPPIEEFELLRAVDAAEQEFQKRLLSQLREFGKQLEAPSERLRLPQPVRDPYGITLLTLFEFASENLSYRAAEIPCRAELPR